ncbi:MAG: serine hydrolase domain-containing protein [Planctomycetota bacterium]
MTRSILSGISLLLIFCTQSTFVYAGPPVVAGKVGKQLDDVMLSLDQDKGGFYGSVLVARGKKILLHKSYGFHDQKRKKPLAVDSLWDWASITKMFTAAAILRLEMRGKLSIDDSIRKFYPAAPETAQGVTLRHLMNHTSGLDQRDMPDKFIRNRDGMVMQYLKLKPRAAPGKVFAYSNTAYWVLAAVIELVSKKSYEDYCLKDVLKAAGMREATFIGHKTLKLERVPKDNRGQGNYFAYGNQLSWGYRGSGGLVATTADLYFWHRALSGKKFLNKQAKKAFYQVGLQSYALGWRVTKQKGDTIYSHGGDVGNTTMYYFRSSKHDVVIALAYGYKGPGERRDQTCDRLFRIALQKQ